MDKAMDKQSDAHGTKSAKNCRWPSSFSIVFATTQRGNVAVATSWLWKVRWKNHRTFPVGKSTEFLKIYHWLMPMQEELFNFRMRTTQICGFATQSHQSGQVRSGHHTSQKRRSCDFSIQLFWMYGFSHFFSWYIDTFFHFSKLPTHGATIQVFGTRRTAADVATGAEEDVPRGCQTSACKIGWFDDSCSHHGSYHAFLKMRKFSLDAMRCHMSSYKHRYFPKVRMAGEKHTQKKRTSPTPTAEEDTNDTGHGLPSIAFLLGIRRSSIQSLATIMCNPNATKCSQISSRTEISRFASGYSMSLIWVL